MKYWELILFMILSSSLSALTLEEKIGQLLMVHFRGEEVNDDAKMLIEKAHVGAFIYYNWANGLNSPAQVKTLICGLQVLAKIPLLVDNLQKTGRIST